MPKRYVDSQVNFVERKAFSVRTYLRWYLPERNLWFREVHFPFGVQPRELLLDILRNIFRSSPTLLFAHVPEREGFQLVVVTQQTILE